MFSRRQYHLLMVLISIVATCTAAGESCSADKVCSGIRTMGSQSPLWEVLNETVGLVQLYYNNSLHPNENAFLPKNEDWTLELHQLFQIDNKALTNSTIQNCSIIYNGLENTYSPFANGTSNLCKLKVKTENQFRETIFISENCHECRIKGKVHSAVYFMKCPPNSSEEAKWSFNYVYTGWYVLLAGKHIVSAPVWLETNYVKQNEMKLTVLPKEKKKRNVEVIIRGEALNNDCSHPMINASCINVKIKKFNLEFRVYYNKKVSLSRYGNWIHLYSVNDANSSDISTFQVKTPISYTSDVTANLLPGWDPLALCAVTSGSNKPKHCIKKGNESLVNVTNLSWNNAELIFELEIMNSLPGNNIQVFVQVLDTRCRRDRVWVWYKRGDLCVWKSSPFNLSVVDDKTNDVELQDASKAAKRQLLWFISVLVIVMTAAIIVLVIIFLVCRRKIKGDQHIIRDIHLPPTSMQTPTSILQSSDIFLLYARDCDPFMKTMIAFRQLLRRTTKLPVLDIWEESMRNKWDSQGFKLALNGINSENTQVIVVATPVSRMIEKLILSQENRRVFEKLYKLPNALDEVFVSALDTSIRWVDAHPDRCRKFIVVRMDTKGCSENLLASFKTLCTVYTLPTLLNGLFQHILEDKWDQNQLSQQDEELLETKVRELDKYLLTNETSILRDDVWKKMWQAYRFNSNGVTKNSLLHFWTH